MARGNIRVLVVDDSAVIREILSDALTNADGIEVVATAGGGKEALALIQKDPPDVVTLDIQMPGMDGLETLSGILKCSPLPVIMVSALAKREADITLQSLELGALDYVTKPNSEIACHEDWREALIRKIRTVAPTDVRRVLKIREERKQRMAARRKEAALRPPVPSSSCGDFEEACIAIGISTGGPPALNALMSSLQPPLPPIVIVQHMPAQFTLPFAARLDSVSELSVKEAATGDVLESNKVYVAPGGQHLYLRRRGTRVDIRIRDEEPVCGHKPSVDVMMQTAAKAFSERCLGVIMTGMGHDGANGCGEIRAAGGYVLGQDQASSDVYGMNKVAFTQGHVDKQVSLEEMHSAITRQCRRLFRLKKDSIRG